MRQVCENLIKVPGRQSNEYYVATVSQQHNYSLVLDTSIIAQFEAGNTLLLNVAVEGNLMANSCEPAGSSALELRLLGGGLDLGIVEQPPDEIVRND